MGHSTSRFEQADTSISGGPYDHIATPHNLPSCLDRGFVNSTVLVRVIGEPRLANFLFGPTIELAHRRIGGQTPLLHQYRREVMHSLRSIAIFGLMAALMVQAIINGWTRMYFQLDQFGWAYFVISIGLIIVAHDAYFYWTHRLMHHRSLYRWVHHTHHLSTNPSPWAAYAFSPVEAFVQAGIAPLVFFTMPVHPLAFALFMIWQISLTCLGIAATRSFPTGSFVVHWAGS